MHTRTSLNPACCRWLIVVAGILLGSLASSRSALATASFEEQVVELINDERAALDLPPLIMDNRLYNAAEHHADWMATHEILDHTEDPPTPPHEYDEPKQRAITYGYCSEMSITALGEAIGMGHTTPEEIVEDWMGSPGHYMVIMSSSGRHIGSGYVYDGSKTYKHYWSVTVARCSTDPEPLARTIGADAQGVQALATADLDGDGDVDVVAAEYDHNKVAWYANSGDATPSWTKHDIGESGGTVANGARSVHAADIDGDGDIDVLAALETDDKVMLYENQGNAPPTWVNVTIDSAAYNARAVFAADADDDGDLDVVASYYNDTLPGGYIKFYENDGSWTKHQIFYSTDFDGQSLFAADIDRDGYPDVLSASTSATEEVVRVLVNNGSWGFTEYVVNSDLGSAPQWVTAADIDQDGILDVLSARYGDDKVAWHKTSIVGSSLSWTLNALTPTADGARCVSVADIDSDGDPDVLVAS